MPTQTDAQWLADNAPASSTSPSSDAAWLKANAPAGSTAPKQAQSYATQDAPMSTSDAVKGLVGDTWDAAKGAAKMMFAPPQPGETALTANPAARMIKSAIQTGKQAMEVPAAIRDINASPDPLAAYADAAQRTASQGAGQAVLAAATEGAGSPAMETTARVGGKMALDVAKDVPVVKTLLKGRSILKDAAAETSARRAGPSSQFPDYTPASASDVKAAPSDAVSTPETAPAGETATPEHPQAQAFEKLFNQPLENYMENGKFQTKDFLNEVVKPKTEPPNYVMARHFGAESVPMIEELAGKPLSKWESTAPEGEAQGGTARLRAKQAEPNWAYRARDVGEQGVPAGSHAQFTSDLNHAKQYAPFRGEERGVPQEIIKTDLNKLKPGDYTAKAGPRGGMWSTLTRGLGEHEVSLAEDPK